MTDEANVTSFLSQMIGERLGFPKLPRWFSRRMSSSNRHRPKAVVQLRQLQLC